MPSHCGFSIEKTIPIMLPILPQKLLILAIWLMTSITILLWGDTHLLLK
jgi:hypothetical protein